MHGTNLFALAAAQAQGVLDLVATTHSWVSLELGFNPRGHGVNQHCSTGATVVVVFHTLGLVVNFLASRLVLVGLDTTLDPVTRVREGLLDLVLSGLGRVRSDLLLGL